MAPDGIGEIERRGAFQHETGLQDFPRLLLHGPAATSRANAQFRFDGVVEASDCDARHVPMIALQSLMALAGGLYASHSIRLHCSSAGRQEHSCEHEKVGAIGARGLLPAVSR